MRPFRTAILAALASTAVLCGAAAASAPAALATTPVTMSFAASPGSSAGLTTGTNHEVAALHVAHLASPADGGFAVVNLNGTGSTVTGLAEPNFAASLYGAGTPRMELVPAIGPDSINNDVTGYPHSSGLCPSSPGLCWALGSSPNTYTSSWTDVQLYMNAHGGLKNVYIVADESMAAPYTTDITTLTWNSQALLPVSVANKLTAKDCGGPASDRAWKITDMAGGPSVTFGYWSLVAGKYVFDGQATVTLGHSTVIFVHRPRGTSLGLRYSDGLHSGKIFTTFPAIPVHC